MPMFESRLLLDHLVEFLVVFNLSLGLLILFLSNSWASLPLICPSGRNVFYLDIGGGLNSFILSWAALLISSDFV